MPETACRRFRQAVFPRCLARRHGRLYGTGHVLPSSWLSFFRYCHAVKLAQSGTLLHRKMGYLASTILLPSDSQLLLLITNTIMKDLNSSNILDIQLGLVAASCLVTSPHLQPMLLPRLLQLASHNSHLVRKKVLIVLHRFFFRNIG